MKCKRIEILSPFMIKSIAMLLMILSLCVRTSAQNLISVNPEIIIGEGTSINGLGGATPIDSMAQVLVVVSDGTTLVNFDESTQIPIVYNGFPENTIQEMEVVVAEPVQGSSLKSDRIQEEKESRKPLVKVILNTRKGSVAFDMSEFSRISTLPVVKYLKKNVNIGESVKKHKSFPKTNKFFCQYDFQLKNDYHKNIQDRAPPEVWL